MTCFIVKIIQRSSLVPRPFAPLAVGVRAHDRGRGEAGGMAFKVTFIAFASRALVNPRIQTHSVQFVVQVSTEQQKNALNAAAQQQQ